jgi:ABC-type transport system involved in multi-copper enzyme maturation permease subunit
MKRVMALSVITFWEGIRNRSVFGIVLFALFILGLNVAVAGFFMRQVGKVTVDMNLSALSLAGILLVLFVGLNLIAKDIDRKTIQLVLSKPISRSEYILGKFLGIQMFVLASLLVLLAFSCATVLLLLTIYPDYFSGFSWTIFSVAVFFTYVKLSVLTAIVVLFSTITTSSFITLIFSTCIYIVGATIEDVIFYLQSSFAAEGLAISGPLLKLINIVAYIIPNFAVFDFKIEAAHGLPIGLDRVIFSLGYGALYIILVLLAASLIFRRREFN